LDVSVIVVNWNTHVLLYNCYKSIYEHVGYVDFEVNRKYRLNKQPAGQGGSDYPPASEIKRAVGNKVPTARTVYSTEFTVYYGQSSSHSAV
jgi:hypothetical protein